MALVGLYPKQVEYLGFTAPYAAFAGGIGSGKSHVLCYDVLKRVRPGRLYMVGAPTYPMLRDATMRSFFALTDRLGVPFEFHRTEHRVVLRRTGAEILFRSVDNPDTLRGPNLSGVALDEASIAGKEAFDVLIGRLRQGNEPGWFRACFTPKGKTHWTYTRFHGEKPDTQLVRAATADNPFLPPEFAERVRRQYGMTQFARQELEGEFVQVEGAEWPAAWLEWDGFRFRDWPPVVCKVIYLDPSKGLRDKGGDYQAFASAGLGRDGTIYLDVEQHHLDAPAMVSHAIDLCLAWGPVDSLVLEDNGTLGFIGPEVARQAHERKAVIPWDTITNTDPKVYRMRSLGGYLSRKQIRVREGCGGDVLVAQMGDFPMLAGGHDDALDAASGAVRRLELLSAGFQRG